MHRDPGRPASVTSTHEPSTVWRTTCSPAGMTGPGRARHSSPHGASPSTSEPHPSRTASTASLHRPTSCFRSTEPDRASSSPGARSALPASPPLTPREEEVLDGLLSGQTYAQIAARLFISDKTVSSHVSNVLRKTGTANRIELAERARRSTSARDDPRGAGGPSEEVRLMHVRTRAPQRGRVGVPTAHQEMVMFQQQQHGSRKLAAAVSLTAVVALTGGTVAEAHPRERTG